MRHLLLVSLILLAIISTQAQNKIKVTDSNNSEFTVLDTSIYKCTYSYQYTLDSLRKESERTAYMFLQIGSKNSYFESEFNYYIDSLLYLKSKGLVSEEKVSAGFTQYYSPGPNYHILQKHNTPEIKTIESTTEGTWASVENVQLNWKLGNETDTINGYYCKNAHTSFHGRNYTAWYTPEIPMPYGPYKFFGLPGLIIKIGDLQNTHVFELKNIQKQKFDMIVKNEKTIKMTPKQLKKALRSYQLRVIELAKMWFANDPDKVEKTTKRILNENNPIELQ
ncbi:GLPGLI family protein [Ancylomarina longa]|uniref:GLPGLI family protein n=1 Tax=Ancylomarina longa TaxID=2487017 RepID=A0A434AG25_9BACT|nr:GLPGLI family protein [Ancylomarina longa]RUT73329.1 GLPGLI family protein [Ancylomarina longa]